MQMIDLSHPLRSGMQVYPGDPGVHLDTVLSRDADGVDVTAVELGSHSGTHVDAPSHTVPGGRTVSQLALSELTGQALVIRVDTAAGELIDWLRISDQAGSAVPRIVVLATGWDRHFGTQTYLDHPVISLDAVTGLWNRGMRLLALDTPSPDATMRTEGPAAFAVHEFLLGRDGLIVENLRGASRLPASCTIGFFPLPLAGSDGAPVRAVAWPGRSPGFPHVR